MHPWRPIAIVGTGFAGIAMFFPFATMPVVGSLDGFAADAWPALLPLLLIILVAVVGDWSGAPRPGASVGLVLLACASLVFAILKLTDAAIAVRGINGASIGAGSIVLLGGVLVVLASTIVALSRSMQ